MTIKEIETIIAKPKKTMDVMEKAPGTINSRDNNQDIPGQEKSQYDYRQFWKKNTQLSEEYYDSKQGEFTFRPELLKQDLKKVFKKPSTLSPKDQERLNTKKTTQPVLKPKELTSQERLAKFRKSKKPKLRVFMNRQELSEAQEKNAERVRVLYQQRQKQIKTKVKFNSKSTHESRQLEK